MNRGKAFWLKAWEEGWTPFHRHEVSPDLPGFWSELALPSASRVLVPLCGKSLDILWLLEQGMDVVGIELSEEAIVQFIRENHLNLERSEQDNAICYSTKSLQIWVADIFTLNPELILPVDAIYDRAALVALPERLRPDYVKICLQCLKPEGKILLKTIAYDEAEMEGPPYSLSHAELKRLYDEMPIMRCLSQIQRQIAGEDACYQRGLRRAEDSLWMLQW